MNCNECGKANRAGARFCDGCGRPLAPRCPACGSESRPEAQFCDACGAALAARAPEDASARKVVTIVFADLVGSTALHERVDAESAGALMDRYYRALRAVVEAHGGKVVKLLGDGVMAAFGLPRVAEDDAIRAVRAAVAMQRDFAALAREQSAAVGTIGLRVAVNTGEVVVNAATDDLVGDPINVAARLQDVAQDGDVVIGDSTRRLVGALATLAPLGPIALKGRAEQVAAYRVVSLERPGGASAVAFVGRQDELARLAAVYEAATATPAARLAVVLGSPGLGKSRLLDEFTSRLRGATVLTASCEAAGGATFAPIARALRAILGVRAGAGGSDLRAAIDAAVPGGEADRSRIAAGIGALLAGTPASPEETFFVVRRLLAGLATAQPVVLVIDDLHWAEPLLLDLVEHLVQWTTGVPLLLLAAARPELRDTRSALATPGRLATDVVLLGGLDAAAATRLAANVIGADALPAAIAGRVLATSEGNPLFLGELVRMLVDDGVLKREGERWTAGVDLARVEMPPTIRALLAARIERLGAEERLVLERAAVVGRQFSRAAVAHLLPQAGADLDARLEALRRSELIEPDTTWFLGEPALRFHHGLIRDAAYRRVLKRTRAELHARVAEWIEARVGEAVEHDETIGWHLEQAHRHLGELGPLDASGHALGERAARYLAAAGRRALARDDVAVAADLLGRAMARLDPADPARAELALDWCEALLAAGEVGPAADAIAELGRWLGADLAAADRLRGWHTCFTAQRAVLTDPQALRPTAQMVAGAAEALAAAGDDAGAAKAHQVHALALARLGRVGACEAALDQALAAARRAHDRRRANAVLASAPLAALWGPGPVTRASGRCLDVVRVLRITQGAPGVEAVALRCQAVLEALRGRDEAAQRMIAASRRLVEELGITQGVLETEYFAGLVALIEPDAAAAERSLRAAYEGFRAHGLGIDAARAAALLGVALLRQGRAAEAEALSHESEALAGDDLQAAITWRRVRAEALARRSEHAAAVDFARAAVDLAATTDALLHHADARLALAAALRAAGKHDDAAAEEARAIALWEAKGAAVLSERARNAFGRVEPVERAPDDRARPTRPVRRRVGANAATAIAARMDAALAARDAEAFAGVYADDVEYLDHTTGATWGRDGALRLLRSLLSAEEPTSRHEPLATLGDTLALWRVSWSASGLAQGKFDDGAYEVEAIDLIEVDAQGRLHGIERFAPNHLGDAVARLYERYAELLPEGPARARAAGTARSVAALSAPVELDRFAGALGPAVEFVDHNRPVGLPPSRGRDAYLRSLGALLELADDVTNRVEDVLALRSNGRLVRATNFGTERIGGGSYERQFLSLLVFGTAGLVSHMEYFDVGDEAEALARFDELTAGRAALRPVERRVRANAATEFTARLDAAIAARDADALSVMFAPEGEGVDHPTGITADGDGVLRSLRYLLRAEEPTCRHEPLATLGDSLALFRQSMPASRLAGGTFDVGAYQREVIHLTELGAQGRWRSEDFATDRLGDAIVRLYERYGELLPEGPARARARATARSVALSLRPFEDRYAEALSPGIEVVDHRILGTWSGRGAEEVVRHWRSWLQLVDGTIRVDDVLALRPDALLLRWMNSGTDRAGGGAWEGQLLRLMVFGPDGHVTRVEAFDVGHEAEALARFDELTSETGPFAPPGEAPTKPVRRVRANAATAHAARGEAAIAARDAEAFAAMYADESETVDHTTGATLDRQGALSLLALLKADNPTLVREMLATLGDSLALWRQRMSASGFAGGRFDVGPYEREELILCDVDAQGRHRRSEIFAPDHLTDAVVRLHERYAELLPDGPERTRAAATARSVAALAGRVDFDRWVSAMAPAVEFSDHRRMIGLGSLHGVEAARDALRTLFEVADDVANRIDDVLALRSDARLVRATNFGTDRVGGGAYERQFLSLVVFGTDGLITHLELFDVDREADALARFDELTSEPSTARFVAPSRPAKKSVRRVRPNAATANAARVEAAIAARDFDAIAACFADLCEVIDHAHGATYDREGTLTTWRSLLKVRDATYRQEPLATLGDSLALCRQCTSAPGVAGKRFDVGAYEIEQLALIEVDAEGRRRRTEILAADHLGDAYVRLYERYAELLPEGPARARVAGTARSVALSLPPFDLDRYAESLEPAIEVVDHRTLGTWSARGAEEHLRHMHAWLELVDVAMRFDDILDLRPDAFLACPIFSGTDRASGGPYEVALLALCVFGADGRLARIEWFDPDRDAEALARFDELTAERAAPPAVRRRVRPNTATAMAARLDAAIVGRDLQALPDLFADESDGIDHPLHTTWDRQAVLSAYRSLALARAPTCRHEPLATLGNSLALFRCSIAASGFAGATFDVGPYEKEEITLIEVDTQGRHRGGEVFAADHLGDAVVRLQERYAELLPEGPTRTRATARARTMAARLGPIDLDRYAQSYAPGIEAVDHRTLGTWSARGAEALVEHFRALLALVEGATTRVDEILCLQPDASLMRCTQLGTARFGGGAYERPFLALSVAGADGLATCVEWFDVDHDAEALARFDELVSSSAEVPTTASRPARIETAATRWVDRMKEAWEARDWERVAAAFAPGFRLMDRRRMLRLELDRDGWLDNLRYLFEMRSSRFTPQLLATRGDRLALVWLRWEGSHDDVGPSEIEYLVVHDVDDHGDAVALVGFDPDDLDAAYAELDERYTAGEAARYPRTWARLRRFERAVAARDWEQWASLVAPDVVLEDHRLLGWGTLHSRDEYLKYTRALPDLRPDARLRLDHVLALDDRRSLIGVCWVGSREGGPFEIPVVAVISFGPDARSQRVHLYDFDQLDVARACYEKLAAEALPAHIENAATRLRDRFEDAWAARDREAIAAMFAPNFRMDDRRSYAHLDLDREQHLASLRLRFELRSSRTTAEVLATGGDRLVLLRERFELADGDVGPSESESLVVAECDERGHLVALVVFDPDALGAAYAELDRRYAGGQAAVSARVPESTQRPESAPATKP